MIIVLLIIPIITTIVVFSSPLHCKHSHNIHVVKSHDDNFLMIARYVYGTLIGESITRDTKVWCLCMLDSIA